MSLTHEEACKLAVEAPGALAQRALAEREAFVFSVRSERALGAPNVGWGGEVVVCLNRNLVLHFVSGFNDDMGGVNELPQFVVMPSDGAAGTDEVHAYEATEELASFDGVVFWVGADVYDEMVKEIRDLAEAFDSRALLPDVVYSRTRFVHLVTTRILDHKVARNERQYDFTKLTF